LGVVLPLLGLVVFATATEAQSCCGVVAEDELAVVSPHRTAVAALRISGKRMFGRHDSEGNYRPLADGVAASDGVVTLGGGVRMPFYQRLQLHGAFSGRVQQRQAPEPYPGTGSESATSFGAGDASLFVRWSALYDDQNGLFRKGASPLPSLDLYTGAKAPTARFVDGPRARDAARTMGDGTWGVIVGVRAIKYITAAHAARISLRYDARFNRDAGTTYTGYSAFSPGDQVGLTLAYLGLKGMRWMFGCAADFAFTLPSSARPVGGSFQTLSGTSMRETTLGAHLTRVLLMPRLDLTANVGYTLPVPKLSRNISWEGVQGGLTLRYHVM
jgi:hypothetical protein